MGTKIGILRNIAIDQQSEVAGNGVNTGELEGVISHLESLDQSVQEFDENVQAGMNELKSLVQKEADDTQTLLQTEFNEVQTKQTSQLTETQSFHTDTNTKLDTVNGSVGTASTQIQQLLTDKFSGISTDIGAFQQSMETELVKLENGQSSAAQQLTELETLITTTNSKLDSILTKLDSVIVAINTQGQAIVDAINPTTA